MSTDPPPAPSSSNSSDFLQRAYALSTATGAKDLYDEWATRYDSDLHSLQYASPARAVQSVRSILRAESQVNPPLKEALQILDAGCGTGLVGVCLREAKLPYPYVVDGLDLSPRMLEVAREKGLYRNLEQADLSKRIECPDEKYDVVLCVGTLTKGHVGPELFREMARVTKGSKLIVATVHEEIWESGGYRGEVEGLEREGLVGVVQVEDFGITEGERGGGKMVVLRKK